MSTVLVCDDHRIVREGLRIFVQQVPGVERVETAASGEEVMARYPHERPDLVLMDVRMPGLGGLQTTRALTTSYPQATVVMLTAAEEPDQLAVAVGHGARGYLLKDVSGEELCTAVARALAGHDLVPPSLRRAMLSGAGTAPAGLTRRELDVLTGMSAGQGNAQIGRELYLSEDTIKTHARRLFHKLQVHDRAQAVASGFRRGLLT